MPIFNNAASSIAAQKEAEGEPARRVMPYVIEINDLCEMLNVGKNTAYHLIVSGEIDAFKVGSVWKIPLSAVEAYIALKCKQTKQVKLYTLLRPNQDLQYDRQHGIRSSRLK